jgi:hypothetical protein
MDRVRDKLWLWGTRVNALQEHYGFSTSTMTISEGLGLLGIDRAMMCGMLPPTEEEYRAVSNCRRILWEMSFEKDFSFEGPLRPILELNESHPNVEGVLLDDFSTTEISKGAQPDVLRRMREVMPGCSSLWIVIYSMSLDIPNLADYLKYADGISFWVWHARDLPRLSEHLERCNQLSGGKPTVVGLYLYDFGENRRMSVDQMRDQVDTGLRLVAGGECEGLCFLSSSVMDIGLETVEWTRKWISRHGDDSL